MDSQPLLAAVLGAMHRHRLEAVLIGNAAAALHGAPVTTLDLDFMFRETPTNLRKLKAVCRELDAVILRPFYPISKLYRMINDDRGMQVDFMPVIHGVRSFNSLRSRAVVSTLGGHPLLLASLDDIIASKRSAGRPRDRAVLAVLDHTLREKNALLEKTAPRPPKKLARRARRRK